MSDGVILVIIFAIMLFTMFMGTPVFTSMGITAIIAMLIWMRPQNIAQFGVIAYTQGTSFNQVIAPMFIVMSEFLSSGGIAEDIYAVLNRAVGKLKGGTYTDNAAAKAKNVRIVVETGVFSREMVAANCGADSLYFIGGK